MLTILNIILIGGTLLLLIPFAVFCLECTAALLPWRPKTRLDDAKPARVAVLLPAHNESSVIARTLDVLLPTLGPDDRAVVIADNCSDDTAEIARSKGAIACERTNLEQRGKGYALDLGVQHLKSDPPDVVMVLDADCNVDPATVRTIGQLAHNTGRPVQSLNLGELDDRPDSMFVASSLGNYFINYVRPLGLKKIGLSYRLLGTGMALPWEIIKDAPLATGHIVEDTRLGVDLAIAGHLPIFCPDVRVLSRLPQQKSSFVSQRTRWEHGHMQAAFSQVPRLIKAAFLQRSLSLFWLAMDIAVPPFSLMIFLWMLATMTTAVAALLGASIIPFAALAITGLCLIGLIGFNWFIHCRHAIPLKALVGVPKYVFKKLPIYFSFLVKRQQEWVRTDRETDSKQTMAQ
ncbi:MAG: glycosyl transferase [Planctomyces sp.]|nr:glycosyl transferase [Planctomyces sp.]